MFRNFFITAWRSITRQKLYSLLNILGLTGGITASLLLFLYIQDELSYDGMHSKGDQIYRVDTYARVQDTELNIGQTMPPMGPALKNDYPEVLTYTRINTIGRELVKKDVNQFYETDFYLVDSAFFEIFDIRLLKGDPKTALVAPQSIVLCESVAKKYFGEEDPIGQELKTGAEEWVKTVTGVMQDPFPNTHIKPRGLISYSSIPTEQVSHWGNINDILYIVLPRGYDYHKFEAKFPEVYDKYISDLFTQFGASASFSLTPFRDIHLRSPLEGEMEPGGSMGYIYIFSAIGIFILLIASINYMNMATARATSRAKEVGIRKVMGSYRKQLGWQFVIESMLIAAISSILSLMLAFLLIPSFNELTGKQIPLEFYTDPTVILGFLIIVIFVGTVSGSYPAFYLSSFRPAEILKGKMAARTGNAMLRKTLVVIQFAISLVMIVSTWIVYDQLNYMDQKSLGFNQDQTLRVILNGKTARDKYDVLRNKLMQNPAIEAVASGQGTPGGENLNMNGIGVESNDGDMISKVFQTIRIDQNYISTLQIPIVTGRDFLPEIGRDTSDAIIVNETMVKTMGWDEPIGKRFEVIINDELETREKKVVGVISDFHLRALHSVIEPLVIHMSPDNGNMILRIKTGDVDGVLAYLEGIWKELIPDRPLEYNFIKDDFAEQYAEDERKGEIFAVFSGLTVLIACLGLFGLASYNSEMKKKEIGIRKVVGAGFTDILVLMSKEFLKLVAISMVIAFPLAYLLMNNWLTEFSYRVDISVLTYFLSAALTVIITLLTVGYHSVHSAYSKPSEYLKEE